VPFNFLQHLGRLLNYVDRGYPVGTPLEELDVDLRAAPTTDPLDAQRGDAGLQLRAASGGADRHGTEIVPTLAHEGSAAVVGLDLAALVR
jgi:hypothetical protein